MCRGTCSFSHRLRSGSHERRVYSRVCIPSLTTSLGKQGVEVHNVFTDKVIEFVFAAVPEFVEVKVVYVAVIFYRGHISDWCVEPDVEEFIFLTGDIETEVGAVAGNVQSLSPAVNHSSSLLAVAFWA